MSQETTLFIPSDGNMLFKTLAFLHKNCIRADHYEGVGSGAIVATLLFAGISADRIVSILVDSDILNQKCMELRGEIERVIGQAMLEKYGIVPSMQELYQLSGSSTLRLHVYNTTTRKTCTLDHCNTPDLSITTACSMAHNLGVTYYEHMYCGNVYTSAGCMFGVPRGGRNRVCVHTRSMYIDGPTTQEEYTDLELDAVRKLMIDQVSEQSNTRLVILEVHTPPWDNTRETKLRLLT